MPENISDSEKAALQKLLQSLKRCFFFLRRPERIMATKGNPTSTFARSRPLETGGDRENVRKLVLFVRCEFEYIAHLYSSYLKDPASVDPSWKEFFVTLNDREITMLRELHGASWTPAENRRDQNGFATPANTNANKHGAPFLRGRLPPM